MSEELKLNFVDPMPMRYGENSHQAAVFYRDPNWDEASLATAKQLHGQELSYNNIVDDRIYRADPNSTVDFYWVWASAVEEIEGNWAELIITAK